MVRIHVHRPLEVLDRAEGVAAVGQNAAHLIGVLGAPGPSLRSGTAHDLLGFVELAQRPQFSSAAERAVDAVVACLFRPLECCDRILVPVQRGQRLPQIKLPRPSLLPSGSATAWCGRPREWTWR